MLPAAAHREPGGRYTSERYFGLVAEGVLSPDDRVELLEGVIVAMAPQSPRHAWTAQHAHDVLHEATRGRAVTRMQLSLVLGRRSVPEPDVAVVPGDESTYQDAHPTTALLVVEVADSSLAQDRLTKAGIYAAAGVPEFWLVNLREARVEVHRDPDRKARRYTAVTTVGRDGQIASSALPGVAVAVAELLPAR